MVQVQQQDGRCASLALPPVEFAAGQVSKCSAIEQTGESVLAGQLFQFTVAGIQLGINLLQLGLLQRDSGELAPQQYRKQ